MKRPMIAIGICPWLIMAVACSVVLAPTATPPAPPPTTTRAPATATLPAPTATLARAPLPATSITLEAQVLVGTFVNGRKELTFSQDGTWYIRDNGLRQNQGTFILKGDQLTFIDVDDRSDSCPPDQEPGVYRITFDGQTLTFTKVNDPCMTGRIGFFVGQWSKP